jgi:hypothetical protein
LPPRDVTGARVVRHFDIRLKTRLKPRGAGKSPVMYRWRPFAAASRSSHFCRRQERLSLFDDRGGKFCRIAVTDIPRRMDRYGRDKEDIAGFECHRFPLDLVFR